METPIRIVVCQLIAHFFKKHFYIFLFISSYAVSFFGADLLYCLSGGCFCIIYSLVFGLTVYILFLKKKNKLTQYYLNINNTQTIILRLKRCSAFGFFCYFWPFYFTENRSLFEAFVPEQNTLSAYEEEKD